MLAAKTIPRRDRLRISLPQERFHADQTTSSRPRPDCLRAAFGWGAHRADVAVYAQHSTEASRTSQSDLAFQFGGTEIKDSLTLYNSANRTLYVYPAASGSSKINCAYSLHVERPGAAIERQNCEPGSFQ